MRQNTRKGLLKPKIKQPVQRASMDIQPAAAEALTDRLHRAPEFQVP